jgi:hypothetical protein
MSAASFAKCRILSSILYCIVFAGKIKEIFSEAHRFFADFFKESCRKRQQMYQK